MQPPDPISRGRRTRRPASAAATALALGLLASGCHTLQFDVADAKHVSVVHHQRSYFLGGLLPRHRVDVSAYCPAGVAAIREQTTSRQAWIGVATLGVWTPRSSWYYCLPEERP